MELIPLLQRVDLKKPGIAHVRERVMLISLAKVSVIKTKIIVVLVC